MKWIAIVVGVLALAIIVLLITNSIEDSSTSLVRIEGERTEQVRLTEQTKQEAAQLRVEEAARVTNYLATIFGPIIGIGLLVLVMLFLNDKLSRNRMWEEQQILRIEQQRYALALENKRDEILLLEDKTRSLAKPLLIEQSPRKQLLVWEEYERDLHEQKVER